MSREVMQQSLEALEAMQAYAQAERKGLLICDNAITALREALAQPADTGDRMAYEGAREDLLIWKRRALEAEKTVREQAQPVQQEQEQIVLAQEVIGCFHAAEVEGLTAALANTTDEHLKDLVERRLMHALYAAQETQEEQNERN